MTAIAPDTAQQTQTMEPTQTEEKINTTSNNEQNEQETDVKKAKQTRKCDPRVDLIILAICIALCIGFGCFVVLFGYVRGWNSQSGYEQNDGRFEKEPGDEEKAGNHYFWKLSSKQTTWYTHLVIWVLYIAHQMFHWAVIYWSQAVNPKYQTNLHLFNWAALIVHLVFHCLHLAHTHILYDALAQTTPISSSQGSVIMLLVLVIVIEYRDRGILFGWPALGDKDKCSNALRVSPVFFHLVRKYHGYAFSWAAIYTFWYHPAESTWGHAVGFMHTSLIMLQGSLMFTRAHTNKMFVMLVEVWVIIHSGIVANQTGGPEQLRTKLWPMFVFGFLLVFVLNQLFGLTFIWRKLPKWLVWVRVLPFLGYIGLIIGMYSWIPDAQGRKWVRMQEVIRIPAIEFGFALWALFLLFVLTVIYLAIQDKLKIGGTPQESPANHPVVRFIFALIAISMYAIIVGVGVPIQTTSSTINLTVMMVILVFFYILASMISFFFISLSLGRKIPGDLQSLFKCFLRKKPADKMDTIESQPQQQPEEHQEKPVQPEQQLEPAHLEYKTEALA